MKYNNGDMDDLFRRASDRYPLRTDSADWDRLANSLDKPAPLSDGEDTRLKRRGVFWWFLLLPLAGIGYMTWQVRAHPSVSNVKTATVQKAPRGSGDGARTRTLGTGQQGNAAGTGNTVNGAGAAGAADGAGVIGGAGVAGGSNAGVGGNAGQTQSARAGGAEVRKMRNRDINSTAGAGNGRGLRQAGEQAGKGHQRQQTGGESTIENMSGSGDANETGSKVQKVRKMRNPDDKESDAPAGQNGGIALVTGTKGSVTDHSDHPLVLAALDMRRAQIAGGYNVVVDVQAPVRAVDSTPAKKATKRNSHVYIGLSGAPDLSTVKFQSTKGVGTTFGLLLGYSFNDRWAVETGLYLDRKRYYTDGEYFNTKNVRLPYNDKLLNVDGTCYMWEIPLNVRYNFNVSPRMKWFATAGLSTYLMSREKYAYQYDYAGAGQTWDSSWNIHRPSQYWFTIVNLSAGFEQRIGKIGNLRVEPYIRVPLSGIGTGKLPIMSAGVNIGITRQLW
jgi:Outer membrane protein beta-barrel domain